jgi:threonine efflux protein
MLEDVNLPAILFIGLIAALSPGPATLAIAGTSMASGRKYGLALASGITTVSFIWSSAAAFGMGALMLANAWTFEVVRYLGAGYLLFLAYKSAKSVFSPGKLEPKQIKHSTLMQSFAKGMAFHLTNPKAILFFGSLYSIGVPANASPSALLIVIIAVSTQGALCFHGYALLFSSAAVTRKYISMHRWFEGLFALAFAAAGLKILTTRI